MSLWAKNYLRLRRHFYITKPIDFTKILKSYNTLLIHPVMEPGREVFSLQAIESVIEHKGRRNVDLLINEKLKFFFNDIASRKIYYKDFTSPFSSNYKDLKENLKGKKYDIFIELNRFTNDMLMLFAIIPESKIRMCLYGSVENPIFNMVIAAYTLFDEIDRNNLILQPLGIKRVKKRIKWHKHTTKKKEKRKIGISVHNNKIALNLFLFLKNMNFTPFLFVNEVKKLQKMQQKFGDTLVPIYPLEKVYEECSSCEYIITSINPVLSIGFLQRKRTLLLLEKGEIFYPSTDHHIEVFSLSEKSQSLFNRIKDFIEAK